MIHCIEFHIRSFLFSITHERLEQFNDVLLQENISINEMKIPAFDLAALNTIENERTMSLELLKSGWYHNVVYLGKENGIPILTMTCSLSDIEKFKHGQVSLRAPSKKYANTLIKGLVKGRQLSEREAAAYIDKASSKPL
ncbi:hypothetical protein K2173_025629 [Erythroxylum novogranatense]|uniref:Uncharacterized protein n=1 Tax=Erythroxylum novogranatense TaxID=1862640 RepID=A0AAV8SNK3_9ROSI|nr:hypothetical protein K2173_025629 [Erythroxylum novogranatense]